MKMGTTVVALCLAVALAALSSLAQAAMRLVDADTGNHSTWSLTDSGTLHDDETYEGGSCGGDCTDDGAGADDGTGSGTGEGNVIIFE